MYVALLGTVEVFDGARAVEIAGARLGRLLTRLAVDAGRPVSVTELAASIWGDDERPADPSNSLQSLVSRLRRTLGDAGTVQPTVAGYRLSIPPDHVDLHQFNALARRGHEQLASGDPQSALPTLSEALALWRGTPTHPDCLDGVERWYEVRLDAVVDRSTAALAIGRGGELLPELEAAAGAHPYREDLLRLQMRTLQDAGRVSEALTLFEGFRQRLIDELGADPSAETRAVHLALLRGGGDQHPAPERSRLTNLRADVSSFVGRADEMVRIQELLGRSRLVTVLGPGGVGKTRLAGRTATAMRSLFPDGVWLVELASVTEESGILQAMLSGIGVRDARVVERLGGERLTGETMTVDPNERLVGQLEQARALLVLDNCEHLIEGVAAVVDELLARCPHVSVLTTSREPLNITGEALAVVPPLSLPPVSPPRSNQSGKVASSAAVQLFVERAASVNPGFRLDDDTTDDVVRIVRRLDGLPLAIELAAARLRVLPLAEISTRLSDRFRLLTGGSRTALPRHRTLRAVVEWSWDLLTEPERLLAERLAVFPAGSTVESATAVTADDLLPAEDVPDLLSQLVEKSLLQLSGGPGTRYRMLETIREFGIEALTSRGEVGAARTAHAAYFVALAAEVEPLLRNQNQLAALAVINTERDNLLAALRFLTDAGDHRQAIDLACSLLWFWVMTGRFSESANALTQVLGATAETDHPHRLFLEVALAMSELSDQLFGAAGTWEDAQARMRTLSDRFEAAAPDEHPLATVLPPVLAMFAGLPDRGRRLIELALESDELWVRATVRSIRLNFLENEGRIDEIRDDVELAYADFAALGDRWGLSSVLTARARLRSIDGDLDGAITDYERALEFLVELETSDDDMLIMLRLADMHARLGDFDSAKKLAAAVSDRAAEQPSSAVRSIFAGSTMVMMTLWADGPAAAYAQVPALRTLVDGAGAGMLDAHLVALVLATTAYVSVRAAQLDAACVDLQRAYPVARRTMDNPIVATVAVSVAAYAAATDRPAEAAQILGAAWSLRGSDDPTDLAIRQLSSELRVRLGAEFDAALSGGRGLDPDAALARIDPNQLAPEAQLAGHQRP